MSFSSKHSNDAPNLPQVDCNRWFEHTVRAQPHHTDYAGIVWHGAYLTWMEEARIECLRFTGIEFADLVALGCDLPVVELSIRYHRPLRMGMAAIVKTRLLQMNGVRINWDYEIKSLDGQELYAKAQVTLVAVERPKGKIMRQLPPLLKQALAKLTAPLEEAGEQGGEGDALQVGQKEAAVSS